MKAGRIVFDSSFTLKKKIKSANGLDVWAAREEKKRRTVALVYVPRSLFEDPEALAKLEQEVHKYTELDHPHLVRIYGLVKDDNSAAISVEHIAGETLLERCEKAPGGHLEVKEITTWLAELCSALSLVHQKTKTPHGAVCPSNLVLDPEGNLKLAGLGLTPLLGHAHEAASHSDMVDDSAFHLSPQQAAAEHPCLSDDVYGVGSTVYHLLTSKPPFYEGDLAKDLAETVPPLLTDRRRQLGAKGKSIPKKWESVIASCLAKDKKGRPTSISEIVEELDLPAVSTDSSVPGLKKKEPKDKKVILLIVAALMVGLLFFGGSVWFLGGIVKSQLERQAEEERLAIEKAEKAAAAKAAAEQAERERIRLEEEARIKAAEAEKARLEELEKQRLEAERIAAARGGVIVNTEPEGATVTLSGEHVEQSPARFSVIPIGEHTVRIEKKGYETVERKIEIRADDYTDLGMIRLTRATGKISIVSTPAGATVSSGGEILGKTPLQLTREPTGNRVYRLKLPGHHVLETKQKISKTEPIELELQLQKRSGPVAGEAWENDLGMKFNPVPGVDVLFSVFETRVGDFKAFADATGYQALDGMCSIQGSDWGMHGHTWKDPGFEQNDAHPVVGVSWEDAKAFCEWLTQRDRALGVLSDQQYYRLPTDAEWSVAVGLREAETGTPEQKNGVTKNQFPWGTDWPLPRDIANLAGMEIDTQKWPQGWGLVEMHRDKYQRTSPVGSFKLQHFGLRDMCGNVWEWCEDRYKPNEIWRVLRGGSWSTNNREHLLSSRREYFGPTDRYSIFGFRTVVVY